MNTNQIKQVLRSIDYPATRDDIADCARNMRINKLVMAQIESLPGGIAFQTPVEVEDYLDDSGIPQRTP